MNRLVVGVDGVEGAFTCFLQPLFSVVVVVVVTQKQEQERETEKQSDRDREGETHTDFTRDTRLRILKNNSALPSSAGDRGNVVEDACFLLLLL